MRFFIFLFLLSISILPVSAEQFINKTVAVVNGEIITLFDLQTETAPEIFRQQLNPNNPADKVKIEQLEKTILEGMISNLILTQEAERLHVSVGKDEVESEYHNFIAKSQLTPEEFQYQLELQHLTEETFKERIRSSILRSRLLGTMVGRKIVVTKKEIEDYYQKNHDKLKNNNQLQLAILVYPPDIDAKDWAARIKSGLVSFEEAVKKVSVGPKAKEGGDLGSIDVEDLNPEWWKQLSTMKPGDVTDLIDINGLQGQLKLINITKGESQTLEALTPYIEEILREPKLEERLKEYTDQLRKRAVVDIRY